MRLTDRSTTRFQADLCAWLDEHAPPGGGPLDTNGSDRPARLRAWQRTLFDHGWLVPTWPAELGGREASAAEHMLYLEEMSRRDLPRSLHANGLDICIPAVLEHGTDEQIARWVVLSLRGDCDWALALPDHALGARQPPLPELRAVDGGAGWTVSGTAASAMGAPDADRLMIVAAGPSGDRPDLYDAPRPCTVVAVDPSADGVSMRTQPTPRPQVATVTLDDVAVAEADVIGTPGDGRHVMLGIETRARSTRWIANLLGAQRSVDRLIALISEGHPGAYGLVGRLGDLYARVAAVRALAYRVVAKEAGGRPAPELAILPVAAARLDRDIRWKIVEATGMDTLDWSNGFGTGPDGRVVDDWLVACRSGMHTEADREAVADRVLGLPRV